MRKRQERVEQRGERKRKLVRKQRKEKSGKKRKRSEERIEEKDERREILIQDSRCRGRSNFASQILSGIFDSD